MTFDERVLAASRELARQAGADPDRFGTISDMPIWCSYEVAAASLIKAAFHDIYGEKPTAWIAPWEITKELAVDAWDAFDDDSMADAFNAMRDGQLKRG